MADNGYLPALRFRSLTAVYDPLVRLTTRERSFKHRLLELAGLHPGQRVLDLGCGTGTLAIMVKRAQPAARVSGLDGDPEMLTQAEAKAAAADVAVAFDEGLSTALPYEDGCFDRVLSTLFFHHLDAAGKRRTLSEVLRVLAPGGELHVADWGRASDPLMGVLSWQVRLLDGVERTRDNFEGRLPGLFASAGFSSAVERDRLRTLLGTMSLYSATR